MLNEMKTLRILMTLAAALLWALGTLAADKNQIENYRKAAEQGSLFDMTMLASCYEYGNGVKQDAAEALKLYRQAAERGYRVAQIHLGFCYKNGEGCTTNEVEAVKWFRKAAEQNDPLGQYMVGFSHQYGKGVASNLVEAHKWLDLSAAQDYDLAKKTKSEIAQQMTKEQLAEAQRLTREFKPVKAP